MIKINNISYAINGKNILSNINLNIRRNKITVITGKNGSGKSSLIKIINKIIFPSKGSIKSDYSEPIPMLFQKPISLNKSLEDNFLLLSNIKKSKVNKSYFNLFNLNKLKKRKFQNLSEGEKQKVFISRFMSFEQDLIILDVAFFISVNAALPKFVFVLPGHISETLTLEPLSSILKLCAILWIAPF